ncbi:hypothetical protein [Streptomyces sp. CoH27]|uniref:hypothetical protein n=1 Tax=Streptomyces sp. CoH27 TaxID=2875763 RepID=UPI001CD37098|nr:hypothetical protein [Streptomyces sp. CoH27]
MNHPTSLSMMRLAQSWAAAEAAYQRVTATAEPAPSLLEELHLRAQDLVRATECPCPPCVIRLDTPSTLSARLRRRWYAANRGARWITRHCH